MSRGGGGGPRRAPASARAGSGRLLATAAALLLIVGLAACGTTVPRGLAGEPEAAESTSSVDSSTAPTDPESSSEPSEPSTTETPTPDDPTPDASGSVDPSDPPPADSESQTLCDLTQEYVQTLYDRGTADDGAYLDVAALSLSDSLRVWRGLVEDYPDVAEHVDRAQRIYDLWSEALSALMEGDTGPYEDNLAESLTEIGMLPSAADASEVACP